ncbi:MAG: DUF1289 domain-containing protein [Gammaproteobacteria bacterium]|nr:DUF1289 domain-containing protein [Gammaproteobacteria bacterium]
MTFKNTDTPCIGICSTVYGDNVCRGCNRFATEIIEWNTYTPEQKSITLSRLNKLTTLITANYLKVVDPELLKNQCQRLNVRYRQEFDPLTWAYMLLKTHSVKIDLPAHYGFYIYPEFNKLTLAQLLGKIDTELFAYSEQSLQNYN